MTKLGNTISERPPPSATPKRWLLFLTVLVWVDAPSSEPLEWFPSNKLTQHTPQVSHTITEAKISRYLYAAPDALNFVVFFLSPFEGCLCLTSHLFFFLFFRSFVRCRRFSPPFSSCCTRFLRGFLYIFDIRWMHIVWSNRITFEQPQEGLGMTPVSYRTQEGGFWRDGDVPHLLVMTTSWMVEMMKMTTVGGFWTFYVPRMRDKQSRILDDDDALPFEVNTREGGVLAFGSCQAK